MPNDMIRAAMLGNENKVREALEKGDYTPRELSAALAVALQERSVGVFRALLPQDEEGQKILGTSWFKAMAAKVVCDAHGIPLVAGMQPPADLPAEVIGSLTNGHPKPPLSVADAQEVAEAILGRDAAIRLAARVKAAPNKGPNKGQKRPREDDETVEIEIESGDEEDGAAWNDAAEFVADANSAIKCKTIEELNAWKSRMTKRWLDALEKVSPQIANELAKYDARQSKKQFTGAIRVITNKINKWAARLGVVVVDP
ncbi:MAG: hypothetical protein B7Z66_15665 [Chromatiales bacterium 21-64-14]|nr:MAG: hypothetical protein B7Z66_15665 [Chromatiales bacterium 21-64-14]